MVFAVAIRVVCCFGVIRDWVRWLFYRMCKEEDDVDTQVFMSVERVTWDASFRVVIVGLSFRC